MPRILADRSSRMMMVAVVHVLVNAGLRRIHGMLPPINRISEGGRRQQGEQHKSESSPRYVFCHLKVKSQLYPTTILPAD